MMVLLDFPIWLRVLLCGLGAALVFSCLCRARHMTNETTVKAIRYAVTSLASAGFVLILAAALRPDWAIGALVYLTGSILTVQAASSQSWRHGLPEHYAKDSR